MVVMTVLMLLTAVMSAAGITGIQVRRAAPLNLHMQVGKQSHNYPNTAHHVDRVR